MRRATRLAEFGAWLHRQHDPGKRGIEFDEINIPPPDRRVVNISAPFIEPFEHHEVIEIPVQDAWHRQFVQRAGLFAKALGREPKPARRLKDVTRFCPVA